MKLQLLSFLIFCAVPFCVSAAEMLNSADQSKEIPYTLHKEHDTTDIFAIPLDDSEEEEDEEMEELEQLQEKINSKNKK